MAHYLDFAEGGTGYVTIPTLQVAANADFNFECEFYYKNAYSDGWRGTLISDGHLQDILQFRGGSLNFSNQVISFINSYAVGQWIKLHVIRTSNVIDIYVDVGQGYVLEATTTDGSSCSFTHIGVYFDAARSAWMNLKWLKVSSGSDSRHYDATASGGSGTVLPDTLSNQDGTLVNFPVDDSQWVYYDDGSASISYTATLNSGEINQQGDALTATLDYQATLTGGEEQLFVQSLSALHNRLGTLNTASVNTTGSTISTSYTRQINMGAGRVSHSGSPIDALQHRAAQLRTGTATWYGEPMTLDHTVLGSYTASLRGGASQYEGSAISSHYHREAALSEFQMSTSGVTMYVSADRRAALAQGVVRSTAEDLDGLLHRSAVLQASEQSISGEQASFLYTRNGTLSAATTLLTGESLLFGVATQTLLINRSRMTSYTVRFEASPISITFENL